MLSSIRKEICRKINCNYNFARIHKSLSNPYPRTPAMAAGVDNHIWTIEEIIKLV